MTERVNHNAVCIIYAIAKPERCLLKTDSFAKFALRMPLNSRVECELDSPPINYNVSLCINANYIFPFYMTFNRYRVSDDMKRHSNRCE